MPELSTLLLMLAVLLAFSAVAGIVAGLLGVGGGIILVPGFYYILAGLGFASAHLMKVAIATSLATIIVTSARSVTSHARKGAVMWDVLRAWAPGIAVGAVVGVLVASMLRTDMLQAIFGVLAVVVGLYLGLGRTDWQLADSLPTGAPRAATSGVVGFLSVLMGIGGGSFGVPLMTLHGTPIHRAVATAAGFGLVIAVPSVLAFLFVDIPPDVRPPLTVGAVNLAAFAATIAMTLLTAPLGVRLAHAMDPKPLRRAFGVFLILVALNMLRQAVGY